ncbi:MAG: hypothetical protein E6J90_10860 [Deltaproteobacteria bacterium]|nr:MAG: hypothetical protein E6J91_09870 [Deltaproteobacteria bacterium]TMQ23244.1 MAG: hypothetical protein E6J90_10860 [Deltaproteobacteria bacterium]
MRHALLTLTVLTSACLAESANGPAGHTATRAAPACATARPTGSNITRWVCPPELKPTDPMEAAVWGNHDPARPFDPAREGSYTTDTPGLRVYPIR